MSHITNTYCKRIPHELFHLPFYVQTIVYNHVPDLNLLCLLSSSSIFLWQTWLHTFSGATYWILTKLRLCRCALHVHDVYDYMTSSKMVSSRPESLICWNLFILFLWNSVTDSNETSYNYRFKRANVHYVFDVIKMVSMANHILLLLSFCDELIPMFSLELLYRF